MLRVILLLALVTSVYAGESLDPLVKASRFFSVAIEQQLVAIHQGPSLIEFAAKTIVYAHAKAAYFDALREAAPELMNIVIGREARPPELDRMGTAFSFAGEKEESVADQETIALLQRFAEDPDVQKARTEFDRGQKVEEEFHREFDGQDFALAA